MNSRLSAAVVVLMVALALPLAQAGPVLVHDYQFQGNLNDSLGGPSLVSYGGTVGAGSYTFGYGQGLSLSNALANPSDYSIVVHFTATSTDPNNTTGWDKLIDFSNLQPTDMSSDWGLYFDPANTLQFLQINQNQYGNSSASLTYGDAATVVLSRDGTANTVTGSLDTTSGSFPANPLTNGNALAQFTNAGDTDNTGVFSGPNNIIFFFMDDMKQDNLDGSFGSEAFAGSVDRIQIYANQAQDTPPPADVPEPSSLLLLGSGLMVCGRVIRARLAR